MNPYRYILLLAALLCCTIPGISQRAVSTVVITDYTIPSVTQTGVKGSGGRDATNTRSSLWDSTGTNFTVQYGNGTVNKRSITQMTVTGIASVMTGIGLPSDVRVRRNISPYVGDSIRYYNFWTVYDQSPASNATTGTFRLKAPVPVGDTGIFEGNNFLMGFDNIFQNTIQSLHSGNIERLDMIMREPLKPVAFDLTRAGMVVFDRGVGDPFKIAAILTVDANGDPLTYGPLRSVTAEQFGPNLLAANLPVLIMTQDPRYGTQPRPSSQQNQNMRGVFLTLQDLGIAAGQQFYGYSLFGEDVVTADPNWRNYPTTTNSVNMLDPVGVFMLYKDVNSVLAAPGSFEASIRNEKPNLRFSFTDGSAAQSVDIERSLNGRDFEKMSSQQVRTGQIYNYIDHNAPGGTVYYRLKIHETGNIISYSAIRRVQTSIDIEFGPNPVSETLTIRAKRDGLVSVYNALGQLITTSSVVNGNTSISSRDWKPGIYHLQLDGSVVGSVLKQ